MINYFTPKVLTPGFFIYIRIAGKTSDPRNFVLFYRKPGRIVLSGFFISLRQHFQGNEMILQDDNKKPSHVTKTTKESHFKTLDQNTRNEIQRNQNTSIALDT